MSTLFTGTGDYVLSPGCYHLCYATACLSLVGFFFGTPLIGTLYLFFGFAAVGGCSQYAQVHLRKYRDSLQADAQESSK